MPVIIDGETYSEGIDISLDEFFRRQGEGAVISTSQPSPGDVSAMWDELLGSHDEVVFIPMSSIVVQLSRQKSKIFIMN